MTVAKTLVSRLIAASHGHVAVDVGSCPEWGYETAVYPARGTWSAALQTMVAGTVAEEFGCCSACSRDAEEEAMFLSQRSVFAAAGDYLLHQIPTRVGPGAVVYECSECWSDQIEFAVAVRQDPVTDARIVESIDESGHWCLACGSSDCRPEPRAMRASERETARAELRRIAKNHAAEAVDVRRVLAFVAGVRRLTAHEVLRLAPTLPGTGTQAFYEPASRAVQVLFVDFMVAHGLDHWEFGLAYKLAPALDRVYEPTRLINYPILRWEAVCARVFGDGLGEFVRARAIEAYEAHLADQEYYCQNRLQRPDLPNGAELMWALDRLLEHRREFRERIAATE